MEKYVDYDEYIKSPEWKERRKMFIHFWGNSCALCLSPKNLHVHHRCYDRLGCETLSDCIVLYGRHHAQFHGKEYISGRTDTIQNVLEGLSRRAKAGIPT